MIIDVEKCQDCNNCFLACKDEHVDNDWPGYTHSQPLHGHRWMNIMRKERGACPMVDVAYRPTPCMHCDNAPCIEKAQHQAVYKRADGIVVIDPEKATGQKKLVKACPYGAIFWNEEQKVPQKCTFCAHLIDKGWGKPRCVQSCPTDAMTVVHAEEEEMAEKITDLGLQTLLPEKGTRPRIYYRNLHLFDACFIGGSVSYKNDGVEECAENADVTLMRDGRGVATTATDCYGDFKFDGLAEEKAIYGLSIEFSGRMKRLDVTLNNSVYIGNIALD
jgi:Fe-S-cluster-containing dehydrogenase component